MVRLDIKTWINIFRNLEEAKEEALIIWLEETDEYIISSDGDTSTDIFEDGFKTEKEALERLTYIENEVYKIEDLKIDNKIYELINKGLDQIEEEGKENIINDLSLTDKNEITILSNKKRYKITIEEY